MKKDRGIHLIKPNGKGLLETIKESCVTEYASELSIEALKLFTSSQFNKEDRGAHVYGSQDTADLFTATITGDDDKIKEIQDRIAKDRQLTLCAQYNKVLSEHGSGVALITEELDKAYKRNIYDSSNVWNIKTDWLPDEHEYYTCSWSVSLKDGLFCLYKTLEDETGYDIKHVVIEEGLSWDKIIEAIEKQ